MQKKKKFNPTTSSETGLTAESKAPSQEAVLPPSKPKPDPQCRLPDILEQLQLLASSNKHGRWQHPVVTGAIVAIVTVLLNLLLWSVQHHQTTSEELDKRRVATLERVVSEGRKALYLRPFKIHQAVEMANDLADGGTLSIDASLAALHRFETQHPFEHSKALESEAFSQTLQGTLLLVSVYFEGEADRLASSLGEEFTGEQIDKDVLEELKRSGSARLLPERVMEEFDSRVEPKFSDLINELYKQIAGQE